MARISRLGHVGLYCHDLDAQVAFYRDVLGLQVTDEDREHGLVFLSARPEEEHHELLLARGRNVGADAHVIQQVSFRCGSLNDVIEYYSLFKAKSVKLDMVVSHGNAIGVYFYDPEGNRCEVYWPTGLTARQPYVLAANLDNDPEKLLHDVAESVAQYGATGIIDPTAFASQEI
jgi:catechol 2,3-dioxygenase-like lactoylglutathione lyase family enzyme